MTGTASPTLSKTSVIAVGAMNVHIINPEWLTAIKAISTNSKYGFEIDISTPGFRLAPAKKGEAVWTIQPGQLRVESEKCDGLEWIAVQRVFEQLPWTPLIAIGTNFQFAVKHVKDSIRKSILFPQPLLPNDYTVTGGQRSWKVLQANSITTCHVHFSCSDESSSILVNYHTDLTTFPPPKLQFEALARAVSDFSNLREESTSLAKAFCEVLDQ